MQVLLNHGHVFQDDEALRCQLAAVLVRAHGVVASRTAELVRAARQRQSILTRAVQSVLQRTPDDLQWRRLQAVGPPAADLASFQAVAGGHLYSINLLDGTVLLDGSPPSRLPRDITEHPLFRRTFGDANFEVGRSWGWLAGPGSQGLAGSMSSPAGRRAVCALLRRHHTG